MIMINEVKAGEHSADAPVQAGIANPVVGDLKMSQAN